jgi:hypothetical protein
LVAGSANPLAPHGHITVQLQFSTYVPSRCQAIMSLLGS